MKQVKRYIWDGDDLCDETEDGQCGRYADPDEVPHGVKVVLASDYDACELDLNDLKSTLHAARLRSEETGARIAQLEKDLDVCRRMHATVRAIGWRLFADQYKGPEHWDMTPEERAAVGAANEELDGVFGKWQPPDTPENRERIAKWRGNV